MEVSDILDFVEIREEYTKNGVILSPEFFVCKSKDLMVRGKSFYAVWDENAGLWSDDEGSIQRLVDEMLFEHAKELKAPGLNVSKKLLKNFSSNKWIEWQRYLKSLPDNYKDLDDKIIFSNQKVEKKDYVTKILDYPLEKCDTPAYDEIMSTLYSKEDREKLEWAIGSIISGESRNIQKFIVLYGGPGTGKSTVLNIIQKLFPGHYSLFESKELSGNGDFALESLKDNHLIAIQHDGDLSRIEDNTKLNSIISHEEMVVNEKFKSKYKIRFKSFLFMGTNKPVRITDAKSGIVRRLIDVFPTGEKIPFGKFEKLFGQIDFELGGIAYHCLSVFKTLGRKYYNGYIPTRMIDETNDFYNFIVDNYELFSEAEDDRVSLKTAWTRYKNYCEEALVKYPLAMRAFKNELKNYYYIFHSRLDRVYSVYEGFKKDLFEEEKEEASSDESNWLAFDKTIGIFDDICKSCTAQYANSDGIPEMSWDKVEKTLNDLDVRKVHYVRLPENHIVIDFDLKDDEGNKSLEKNIEAASKWPKTYAELSKSGSGIHLHYIYNGDPTKLRRLFAPEIEIKVFTGKSSLRRCLTKCNRLDIAIISSGLPLKEAKKVVSEDQIKSERGLRRLIERNLRKEIHPSTKCSIDFIYDILEGVYRDGLHYDVTDMRNDIQAFAIGSTHQADYCLNMVGNMKFKSEEESTDVGFRNGFDEAPIIIFDMEVLPNLLIICWKLLGEDKTVVRMINPMPEDCEKLTKYRLVGFNNRNYDNHILYARIMGYNNSQLFDLSQRIISGDRDAKFGEAYNLSYTDIYDYLSAPNKAVGGLKKWEIKLGCHHQEFGWPWDKPLPESMWGLCADYCVNDVLSTEDVWNATKEDFKTRIILSKWAKMTPNDTTNSITVKMVVGDDPNPQRFFNYPDLSKEFPGYEFNKFGIDKTRYLPGVKIIKGKSIYKGKDPGEGGYAIGYPGVYWDVDVFDIASMHPTTIEILNLFGKYTENFSNIKKARILIKHGNFDGAKKIIPEEIHEYLKDESEAPALGTALKTPINFAYGLTSAAFPNKLRDPRNVDNVVAKRGALFMINLEEECTNRGWKVVHIKTDSIKIANCTPECKEFIMEYGRKYGYEFEHESRYSRIALVNDAVYIAKYETAEKCEKKMGFVPGNNKKHSGEWTATGTQFAVPYVMKSLFTHEKIEFKDVCETKSVTTALYLDFNEKMEGEDPHNLKFVGKVGCFVPVKAGLGGGILLREGSYGKFSAVNGTKVVGSKDERYRWLEDEVALKGGLTLDDVDLRYHNNLVNSAFVDISQYCDFEAFVADDTDFVSVPDGYNDSGLPFDDFPMNQPEEVSFY